MFGSCCMAFDICHNIKERRTMFSYWKTVFYHHAVVNFGQYENAVVKIVDLVDCTADDTSFTCFGGSDGALELLPSCKLANLTVKAELGCCFLHEGKAFEDESNQIDNKQEREEPMASLAFQLILLIHLFRDPLQTMHGCT